MGRHSSIWHPGWELEISVSIIEGYFYETLGLERGSNPTLLEDFRRQVEGLVRSKYKYDKLEMRISTFDNYLKIIGLVGVSLGGVSASYVGECYGPASGWHAQGAKSEVYKILEATWADFQALHSHLTVVGGAKC